jgi:DNA-binding CsgD family transcriptional regulator
MQERPTLTALATRSGPFAAEQSNEESALPDLFGVRRWNRLVKKYSVTPRQRQVARWICRGQTDKEIARRLGISHDSVRLHVRKLFERFAVRSRMGLLVRLVLLDRALAGSPKDEQSNKQVQENRQPTNLGS